jgi:hypothetical protein
MTWRSNRPLRIPTLRLSLCTFKITVVRIIPRHDLAPSRDDCQWNETYVVDMVFQ